MTVGLTLTSHPDVDCGLLLSCRGIRKSFSWRWLLVLIEMDILVFWNVKWESRSDSLQRVKPVGKLDAVGTQPGITCRLSL